ncbi:MAG: distal tail protein Dit [Candidatus Humimicrobiaceae bacterium]
MSYIEIFGTLFEPKFNSIYLSDLLFYCYDIKKPLMPQQSQKTIDIPKVSGLIQLSKKFTTNKLYLYGFMKCTNYADLTLELQILATSLYSDTDKELILSNAIDRYYNAQYLEYEIIGQRDNYTLIDLEFTCNDPFAYAIIADSVPDSSPPNNVITINDSTFIITNSGHYYAFPVITITFNQAQTHIYVQNDGIDGNRFDITKAFNIGDELEIDCKNGTIKLNEVDSPAGFGDGGLGLAEWLILAEGNNAITVGSDDATINISINLMFNKVYFY